MEFYAHTAKSPDGKKTDPSTWEPLFTPFGEVNPKKPKQACSGKNGAPCSHCQELEPSHGHLNKVAFLTSKFAAHMFPEGPNREAARQWGYLVGLWHDLGKFALEWQTYLKIKSDPHSAEISGKIDHSTAGAQHSNQSVSFFGALLSYLVAGHHAGLTNGIDVSNSNLVKRLQKEIPEYQSQVPKEILDFTDTLPPLHFVRQSGFSLAHFLRFLFSSLVDADFLATESFMNPVKKNQRPITQPSIIDLEKTLSKSLQNLSSLAKKTSVNHTRSNILTHCLKAAEQEPGLFSLTVPTGGGKTLSSLAFALKHARQHKLRRVIYVIPYTSIIEQNAAIFRKALANLGEDIVLEHHSNLDPLSESETTTSRLAAENWDARLIVTTNVQFFESLHANRTSRCRKLHRIARSVIILDEAQSLPLEFMAPCLRSLEEIYSNYQSSVVLCTATQPAIHYRPEFTIGLKKPYEIIPNPTELYLSLNRVKANRFSEPLSNETLARHLLNHKQNLTIVNTRRHARELFELLPNDGSRFHLSALMCPSHRSEILSTVKLRLKNRLPVRLVSTQLIEAGVDIDFPVVYRSLAGLDSIAQAAGRCDREGSLTAKNETPSGQLFLFECCEYSTPSFIQQAVNSTIQVLATCPSDFLSLNCIHDYFQRYYWDQRTSTDQKHILDNLPKRLTEPSDFLGFKFKTLAHDFKLIDDYTEAIIVPYNKTGQALCDKLQETLDSTEIRSLARKLQHYIVTIPKSQHAELLKKGILKPLHEERFFILNSSPHYDPQFGLFPEPNLVISPENSII